MAGDRITLTTVADPTTAQILREALADGGVEDVDVNAVAGNAYLGRAAAVDYQVRVPDVDEARARLVLAQFEEESGAAAVRASGEPPAAGEDGQPRSARERKPWVVWGVVALGVVTVGPVVYALLGDLVRKFLR